MDTITFKNMGLFDTQADWIHPTRVERTYEIIYVTHGTAYLFEEDQQYVLEEGDLILLRPMVQHGGYRISTGHTSFYWLHFFGNIPDEMCGYLPKFLNSGLFREAIHYDNSPDRDLQDLRIITEHILLHIKKAHSPAGKVKIAREVYEWIRININAELTSEAVALRFGYNPEHLSRIMKREYNMTLKKIIDMMLCDKIESLLLNSNYSVKEIAAILGFKGGLSACIHFFEYHKKTSPTRFRQQYSEIYMNLR